MIKKIFSSLLLVLAFTASAQKQLTWKTYFEPAKPMIGEKANLVLEVQVNDGFHIYGTEDKCDRINAYGPLLTELKLKNVVGFKTTGSLKAINPKSHEDINFGCVVTEFDDKGFFKIPIEATGEVLSAKGQIDCMVCKDEVGCFPLDHIFTLAGTGIKGAVKVEKTIKDQTTDVIKTPPSTPSEEHISIKNNDTKVDSLNKIIARIAIAGHDNQNTTETTEECDLERRAGWDDIEITRFESEKKDQSLGDVIWLIFAAFLAGLVTVFTPCVFPMLPMTVTFFTKSNKSKGGAISQALIYGLSIIFIYTAFGVIVGKLFGEEFANELAVNWVVNLVFFIIFIVFALSFLGMFEITLPSGFVNKVDAKADRGGMIGTFFMALALVLVSFSCTGPIVGSIIVLAAQGDWLVPTATMFAFSLAFALPFTITAMFPSLLSKLPKSGGWLNSIKVVLGLLELALAMKFLSQIDQVLGLGILDREVFISIWIGVFVTIALYLFGKLKFPHDSPIESLSVPRNVLGISSLIFAIYLLPGLWGAPLKSLSGIFPPMYTQDFVLGGSSDDGEYLCETPIYGDELHVAHNIKGYFDLRQAICCAKSQKKPLFIDFTGKTCTNCRTIEGEIWSDPKVLSMLKNDFVVVSLYADVNTIELPEEEHYTSNSGRDISTLGKSVQDFQKEKYNTIQLPMYSIVGYDELSSTKDKIILKELAPTKDYKTSNEVEKYVTFLTEAKNAYSNLKKTYEQK